MTKVDWTSPDIFIAADENARTKQLCDFVQKHAELGGHVFLASSGTSSASLDSTKWVALSKSAILASAKEVNERLQVTASDVFFQAITSHHVGGLALHARAYLAGCEVIDWKKDNPKWDVIKYGDSLAKTKATLTSLVPTQIYDFVKSGLKAPDSLRAVVVGGAALSAEIFFAARELGWPLLPSFGMTEAASQIATAKLESLNNPKEYPLAFVLPHMETRVSGQGNLSIKSSALFSGYVFQNAEGKCEFYNSIVDGWFATSDFAQIENGYLTHLGRASDFIKIAGELVSTVKLETVFSKILYERRDQLASLDSVTLAFIPDARLGSSVNVFVEEETQSTDAIKEAVAEFNSRVRAFEKIRAVKSVKNLPKTELGKVIKPQLPAMPYQLIDLGV